MVEDSLISLRSFSTTIGFEIMGNPLPADALPRKDVPRVSAHENGPSVRPRLLYLNVGFLAVFSRHDDVEQKDILTSPLFSLNFSMASSPSKASITA